MLFRLIILTMVVIGAAQASAALFNDGHSGNTLMNLGSGSLLDVGTPLPICQWSINQWNTTTCTWGS